MKMNVHCVDCEKLRNSGGIKAELRADEGDRFTDVVWSFTIENLAVFPHSCIMGLHIKKHEKQLDDASYVSKPLSVGGTVDGHFREVAPKYNFYEGCLYYSMEVEYVDQNNVTVTTPEKCYKMLPPSFELEFAPFSVTVKAELVMNDWIDLGDQWGCVVYLCEEAETTEACDIERLPQDSKSVIFKDLEEDENNYVAIICFSPEKRWESKWTMFSTPLASRDSLPQKLIDSTTNVDATLTVSGDDTLTLSWEFASTDSFSFENSAVEEIEVFSYEKIVPEATYTSKLLGTVSTETHFTIGQRPKADFKEICYYFAINVRFVSGSSSFWGTDVVCYTNEYPPPAPTEAEVLFYPQSSVTVKFQSELASMPAEDTSGCEVSFCQSAMFTDNCVKERLKVSETSVMFSNLDTDSIYYMTVYCFTKSARSHHTPWIAFETPKRARFWIPRRLGLHSEDVKAVIKVGGGFKWRLTWNFICGNGSQFPSSKVEKIDVDIFRKPYHASRPFKSLKDAPIEGATFGMSPSYSFDRSCYIYSLNVTLLDGTKMFHTSDEDCYGRKSASFIFLYVFVPVVAIEVAVVAIALLKQSS